MAKPISAHQTSASSTRLPSTSASRRKRKLSAPAPSTPVLALLATISASLPPAHASPAPPSFLCPSFVPQPTSPPRTQARATRPSSSPPVVRKSLVLGAPPGPVPDRFEQEENGRWRRVDTYTLYGSTSCDEDAVSTILDDQIQVSATSSVPLSTSATSLSAYSISLPPGWKPQEDSSAGRTTLILALSLVLACLICFFIISCIFWRKKKRRRRGQVDVEKKARKRWRQTTGEDDGISMLAEREVKVKQKIWAKATARWKANAKYTARQRRGKRFGTVTKANSPRSSCTSLDRAEETQATAAQLPMSFPLGSPRSSLESPHPESEVPQSGETSHIASIPVVDTRAEQESSRPPSPPAYHGDSLARTSGREKRLPLSESGSSSTPCSSPCDFYIPPYPVHAAHVAIDDKGLLARMAELASAPPPDPTSSSDSSATCHASVPIWDDDEVEDFDEVSHGNESAHRELSPSGLFSSSSSPTNLFPPPPSKGKMAAPTFYDYPYTLDDMLVEPEPGPSAPPFEEESNCHPSEMAELAPSAPPLTETEAAYYADTYPSAPAHGWQYASASDGHLLSAVDAQTQILIPSCDDVPAGSRSPVVQGPVASDGTPPCYHP
ncbi:hypothetical protein C0993_002027 [Termitomyces sp. T159_Od127]|nr:hypothetical protein C0993_002027 [Termitomyces sp. T159_Od127]